MIKMITYGSTYRRPLWPVNWHVYARNVHVEEQSFG